MIFTANGGIANAGGNPFELDAAIKFGLLFGVVIVIAKAAQVYLGDTGLYLPAAIAALLLITGTLGALLL